VWCSEIAFDFLKDFLEAAIEKLAAVKELWSLGVTVVFFLGQKSNL